MSNAPTAWARNDPLAALDVLSRRGGRAVGVRSIYEVCTDQVFTTLESRGYIREERVEGRDGIMDVAVTVTDAGRKALGEIGSMGVKNKATRSWFANPRSERASERRRTRIETLAAKAEQYRCPHCGKLWPGLTADGRARKACGFPSCSGRHGGLSRVRNWRERGK